MPFGLLLVGGPVLLSALFTPQPQSENSLSCKIVETNVPWNPPGKMNVTVDGNSVGSFDFDSNGTKSLDFDCSSGSHGFTFKVNGTQISCSGSFAVDNGHTQFIPAMRLFPNGTTACSLSRSQ